MDFVNGAVGTIITSFDVWGAKLPFIEIHGTKASLSVPDPNHFGGPVEIKKAGSREWAQVPLSHGYTDNSRGLGVFDMANVILGGGELKASGELAFHVLEIMHGFHDASSDSRHYMMNSTCKRPAAMPL
jgi:predicted dehydrogenase